MYDCDFCREIEGGRETTFRQIYQQVTPSRIVLRSENFVVLPTIGQLFVGSVLILPRRHRETFATLGEAERRELPALLNRVLSGVARFGEPIIFEHGAVSQTGGGCGVYHAHLHVVPLPAPTLPSDLFPE